MSASAPDDPLERALAAHARRTASSPPPPPPPFDTRIAPALDAAAPISWIARGVPRARVAAAGVLLAGGIAVALGALRSGGEAPGLRSAQTGARALAAPYVVERGAERLRADRLDAEPAGVTSPDGASPAMRLSASGDVLLRLDDGARVTLSAGARLRIPAAGPVAAPGPGDGSARTRPPYALDALDVEHGRVAFDLGARASPLVVRAGGIVVVDRGTAYAVDVSETRPASGARAAAARVLVTVTEGAVVAGGVPLAAGSGLAFEDGRALGAAWPLDAKPALSLEAESPVAEAGVPVVLRIVLANPTDGWIPWPVSRGAETPVHVEVVPPSGAPTLVRVTDAMVVGGAVVGRAIPPRGREVVRVRFDRTFASVGTYRLRAIFRPADAIESPTSDSLTLVVRSPGAPR